MHRNCGGSHIEQKSLHHIDALPGDFHGDPVRDRYRRRAATILYSFGDRGTEAHFPAAGPIMDAAGNIYGVT